MPLRFYKEGDSVQINNLDDPCDMVGSVLKESGELKFYPLPEHEKHTWGWIDDKYGYRMADVMTIAAMVIEMPECFWVALGEFEDCDRPEIKEISKTKFIKQSVIQHCVWGHCGSS